MNPPCILVVEDNPLNRQLVRDLLSLGSYQVMEATTADEARQRLRARTPDLVLMDIQIPGGGGEALLHEIRKTPGTEHLTVLALTAYTMQGDRERFLAQGFDGYIGKPIDTRQFCPLIDSFLKQA